MFSIKPKDFIVLERIIIKNQYAWDQIKVIFLQPRNNFNIYNFKGRTHHYLPDDIKNKLAKVFEPLDNEFFNLAKLDKFW